MTRLTPERELAAAMQVSRQSLHLAIKQLVEEGLLVQRQGSGTFIVPRLKINAIHLIKAPDLKPDDPYYVNFSHVLAKHLAQESIPLILLNAEGIPYETGESPLVIFGYLDESLYRQIKERYTHILAVQKHPCYRNITQIDVDYYKIGYDAVHELAHRGHTRIVHLAGPEKYPAASDRRRGFEDAIRELGLQGYTILGKMNWSFGYSYGEEFLNEYIRKEGVTGVFTANDWMGIGLINRLTQLSIRIPKEVSVIGCDNIPLSSEIIPGLATYKTDYDLLISLVYVNVNEMVLHSHYTTKQILLPAKFMKRESIGDAPQSY
jgi:DNA-binding LacI/PurR family transcriptional regulator